MITWRDFHTSRTGMPAMGLFGSSWAAGFTISLAPKMMTDPHLENRHLFRPFPAQCHMVLLPQQAAHSYGQADVQLQGGLQRTCFPMLRRRRVSWTIADWACARHSVARNSR